MTTPKPPTLAMWTAIDADAKQPFRELAEEFRRLAAEAQLRADSTLAVAARIAATHRADTWNRAAQMLEEKLNG